MPNNIKQGTNLKQPDKLLFSGKSEKLFMQWWRPCSILYHVRWCFWSHITLLSVACTALQMNECISIFHTIFLCLWRDMVMMKKQSAGQQEWLRDALTTITKPLSEVSRLFCQFPLKLWSISLFRYRYTCILSLLRCSWMDGESMPRVHFNQCANTHRAKLRKLSSTVNHLQQQQQRHEWINEWTSERTNKTKIRGCSENSKKHAENVLLNWRVTREREIEIAEYTFASM